MRGTEDEYLDDEEFELEEYGDEIEMNLNLLDDVEDFEEPEEEGIWH